MCGGNRQRNTEIVKNKKRPQERLWEINSSIRQTTAPWEQKFVSQDKPKRWLPSSGNHLSFEPISGFEPETPSLRVKCSTAELNRQRD